MKLKNIAGLIAALLVLIALLADSAGVAAATVNAVEACLYVIIPALFGFMAISAFLLKSGLYMLVFKPFYVVFRHIFRLNEEQFGIFLLSLFGGYPVGAKLLADSINDGKTDTAHVEALGFCYCPSPGFVIAVVGTGLFSSPSAGLAVYLSNVSACVILALFLSKKAPEIKSRPKVAVTREVFAASVLSASSALFPVCAVITAFGVIIGTLRFYDVGRFIGENAERIIFAALEISNVAELPREPALLPLIAALFSFGGLCILMQIPALIKGGNLKRFFLWRVPAALISAGVCAIFVKIGFIGEASVPASAGTGGFFPLESGSPIASASLLIMALILVKTAGETEA